MHLSQGERVQRAGSSSSNNGGTSDINRYCLGFCLDSPPSPHLNIEQISGEDEEDSASGGGEENERSEDPPQLWVQRITGFSENQD